MQWRRWEREEVPVGQIIRHKRSSFRAVIVSVGWHGIYVGHEELLPTDVFDEWEQLDGTPCGWPIITESTEQENL